jgi:hypothetical protein
VKHVERNACDWLLSIQRTASHDQAFSGLVTPSNNSPRWSIFGRGVLGREVLRKSESRCLSQDGYTQSNKQDHDCAAHKHDLPSFAEQADDFLNRSDVICKARFHRGRHAERLMHASGIVIRDPKTCWNELPDLAEK